MRTLKKASRTAQTGRPEVVARVAEMLAELDRDREDAALRFAQRFDGWTGDPVVPTRPDPDMDPQLARDLALSHDNVTRFAQAQKASLVEFEVELRPGLRTGQKLVPVDGAGCYVPGGRYAHIASAIMSATTARVAGVDRIVAASPPRGAQGPHPAVLHALHLAGCDTALALGGVQGVAALALGLFTGTPAAVVVGPGNAYVAEAKRQLFGRIGIDLYAGPTETLVIADETADVELVAADLVGQAEHGPDSPAVLISLSEDLAHAVMAEVARQIAALPSGNAAGQAWRDCGEVVVVQSREQAAETSDRYASEHLQVHAADLPWWRDRLRSYGSLFLGEETTVTYGDKASGPNHILPTMGAARYTGGLSVHKFIKVLTWQQLTPAASAELAGPSARISRAEGMEAHARAADVRAKRYTPVIAVVTGASSGIGRHFARVLAEDGARVVAVARRADRLDALADQTGAAPVACDLADRAALATLGAAVSAPFGPPQVLVNAAGINLRQDAANVTFDAWDRTMAVNLTAPFFLAQQLVPQMQGWGRVINLASLQSRHAFPGGAAYGASKGGIAQLTRAMARAWSGRGVTANAIAPGFFPTELTAPVFADSEAAEALATRTAIGRNGQLADLDGTLRWLVDRGSDYVTGQIIYVDGGFTIT